MNQLVYANGRISVIESECFLKSEDEIISDFKMVITDNMIELKRNQPDRKHYLQAQSLYQLRDFSEFMEENY